MSGNVKGGEKRGRTVLKLFYTMLKIGLFTFGGGYAMIALLESELVEKKKWIGKDEFLNMIAVAESTPGPVAINSGTYIGYRLAGVWGALAATFGVCLPSFVIIFAISLFLDGFLALRPVAYAFSGIRVGVIYLILSAGVRLFNELEKKMFPMVVLFLTMAAMVLCSLFALNFSTIACILAAGGAGLGLYFAGKRKA